MTETLRAHAEALRVAFLVNVSGSAFRASETFLRAHLERLPFAMFPVIGDAGQRRLGNGRGAWLQSRSLLARAMRRGLDESGLRSRDEQDASALSLGVATCEARGLPCTVFVAPGLLGRAPEWDQRACAGRWRDLDRDVFRWQQARRGNDPTTNAELALDATLRIATHAELTECVGRSGPGRTLANRTHSHANLTALSLSEVAEELRTTQAWLHAFAPERAVPVVAYPYGHEAHEAGLRAWGCA